MFGNGSIFDGMPAQGQSPGTVWRNPAQVRAAYGQSIQYSMNSLVSFVQNAHDKNLVLVVLGDHEPATIVSGDGPGRDVPISVIARDPAVLQRISGWGWQDGLRPSPTAPVWPMDAFRNRFLAAYSPQPPDPTAPHSLTGRLRHAQASPWRAVPRPRHMELPEMIRGRLFSAGYEERRWSGDVAAAEDD